MIAVKRKHADPRWWRNVFASRVRDGVAAIGFRPNVEDLKVNGIAFRFFVATPLGKNWYATVRDARSHEMTAMRALMRLDGATVYEVGAHHGRDCVLLSKMVGPKGRVISFEPHPGNFEVLTRNIELNDLDNATGVNLAVGAQAGEIRIRNRSNAKVSAGGQGIAVGVTTIDDWSRASSITPSIIKIDVEGYEFEVLRGAREVLESAPALIVEMHCDIVEEFGSKPSDLWSLVDTARYDVYLQQHDGIAPVPVAPGTKLHGRPHVYFIPRNRASR
jgi:FkbM family methyltransferase